MRKTASHDNADKPRTIFIRRHSIATRLTHWVNVLCLSVLLLSGLQIFNAHPELYWGHYGANGDPALLTIGAVEEAGEPRGFVRIAGLEVPTTGVLGVSTVEREQTARAFPNWITLPSFQDLAAGRRWHFFFAWLFVINGALYLGIGLLSGHFRRDLAPQVRELSPRHLGREVLDHARLRFPEGDEARHYNALQKLTYLAVIVVLLPLMVLTGLTMSPGVDAALPALVDLFGGRQSARTIHFITASALVLFVVVHVAMVILSGTWNNIRSMITGRYAITEKGPQS
ncbi:cytochrome b/b6 domain-containing protein [Rhizobium sp. YIM 134829]|uniref:cytochrome b/b6 domain-containing protein n=1 Tax=Rhizobium sp. YIM 134829 TaxID=3390453 RepID=UPI0039785978